MERHPEEYDYRKHEEQRHNAVFRLLGSKLLHSDSLCLCALGCDIGLLEPATESEIYHGRDNQGYACHAKA